VVWKPPVVKGKSPAQPTLRRAFAVCGCGLAQGAVEPSGQGTGCPVAASRGRWAPCARRLSVSWRASLFARSGCAGAMSACSPMSVSTL